MQPCLECVLDFLASLYERGLGYSAVNTARSALSTFAFIDGKPAGQHPLVTRLLKGIFNSRPSLPRNNITWDPEILLRLLRKMSPVAKLNLFQISLKTTALIWLLSGQRCQSLHLLDIRNVIVTDNYVKLRWGDKLKTTRPGYQQQEIKILAYAPDRTLCLVTVLKRYLLVTKSLRTGNNLLITTQKPHGGTSKDTISRWVKVLMTKAGLDMEVFTPHSVRAASTSAALRGKVPIHTILNTAGWSNQCTFSRYYNKPVKESTSSFSNAVLASRGKKQ